MELKFRALVLLGTATTLTISALDAEWLVRSNGTVESSCSFLSHSHFENSVVVCVYYPFIHLAVEDVVEF